MHKRRMWFTRECKLRIYRQIRTEAKNCMVYSNPHLVRFGYITCAIVGVGVVPRPLARHYDSLY
jgi:hypothetical protein